MSLFLDIGTGAGLAGASGVRPFLPPLLAGALASDDLGIDFKHTPYDFLQRPAFLAVVLALTVLSYIAGRVRRGGSGARRVDPLDASVALVALVIGALLFAGSIAQAHHQSWPGLIAGVLCAALGYVAVALLVSRARRRVEGSAASLLVVYADLISLAIAGIAIALPPAGLVALVVFCVLVARTRSGGARKFEGLRILR